jgi:aspartyl/asparaginyl-tRNA synthetase
VKKIRDQKTVQFVMLRDHTGIVQVITNKNDASKSLNEVITNLPLESAVSIIGKVLNNPYVKMGGIEISLEQLVVNSAAERSLPIDLADQSKLALENRTETDLDVRLDWRFLDLRRPENLLIFQIQTAIEMAMREFWISENFIEIHSPKLMGTPSESGAELFGVEYFGRNAYLAQSPQFYKQMAMAAGFDKVFEIGPVFRANPSNTSRHIKLC